MILAMGAAAKPADAGPSPECAAPAACRFVPDYNLRMGRNGKATLVHASKTIPFVRTEHGRTKLTLFPGETVVLRLGGKDEPDMVVLEHARADDAPVSWTEIKSTEEAAHLVDELRSKNKIEDLSENRREITDQNATYPDRRADEPAEAPAPVKDTIRVTLKQLAGMPDMFLLVQDGYGRTLSYEAEGFYIDGRWIKLGNCLASSDKTRAETYMFPLAELSLSHLRLTDADPEEHNCPMFRMPQVLIPTRRGVSAYSR
jgi:hypothetical protein